MVGAGWTPMPVPLFTVDAFTRLPYTGNPAAVCLLEEEPSEAWMLNLAAEMNLSETAFTWPKEDTQARRLRWFTPEREVDLCGHATLATAHVLFDAADVDADDELVFHTNGGALTCRREEEGRISMDFPSHPPYAREDDAQPRLEEALGTETEWVGENGLDLFVVLDDEKRVRALEPDTSATGSLGGRGVIVTAESSDDSKVDFVSRFFAPAYGVPEDPVTGSAHCALGPYWANRLDQATVVGRQVSDRGGTVHVEVTDEGVRLEGHTVTIFEAELTDAAGPGDP